MGIVTEKYPIAFKHLLSKYIFKSAIFVLVLFDFIFGLW